MLRISAKQQWRGALVALACAAGFIASIPANAAAATTCTYPSATYTQQGNFYTVFQDELSAEVCRDDSGIHLVWTSHRFGGLPGWNNTELGRAGDAQHGWFWDAGRYGGSWTIWADERDTFGYGPLSYPEDVFLRIWVSAGGQTIATYGGL